MKRSKSRGAQGSPVVAVKDAILDAALPHVAFDGWTRRLFSDAVAASGVDPAEAALAYPNRERDLLEHFADWADRRMLDALGGDFDGLKLRQKVARAVRRRLEALAPHREAVRRALAPSVMPGAAARSARLAWRTADRIWRAAGDDATDFNHYTKRALLVGVHAATALYWLDDQSEGHKATWAFLDRRIDDALKLGRRASGLKRLGDLAEMPFRVLGGFKDRIVERRAVVRDVPPTGR